MDIHPCKGYLFHLEKLHSKLMKIFLAESVLFFQRGTITETPKQLEHPWEKLRVLQSLICRYVVFCLMCGFEIYRAHLNGYFQSNIVMSMKRIPGVSAHLSFLEMENVCSLLGQCTNKKDNTVVQYRNSNPTKRCLHCLAGNDIM